MLRHTVAKWRHLTLLFKQHEIWLVAFLENRQIVATRCQNLWLKCTKFDFGWGSDPDPAGKLTTLPQTS